MGKANKNLGAPEIYDSLGFNLNKPKRIAFLWTEKEVIGMTMSSVVTYSKMMDLYTKGTSGNVGVPFPTQCGRIVQTWGQLRTSP